MRNQSYRVVNAYICQIGEGTVSPIFGDMSIENGKIQSITPKEFSPECFVNNLSSENVHDAQGRLLTIPLVNFHDHIYSRLAKGIPTKGDFSNFPGILKNLWWKLDLLLDKEMNQASAQMAALESIRNGVTYIFDHHASPSSTKGSLKTIKDVLSGYGLRGVLCFETSNRNGEVLAKSGLDENLDFVLNHSDSNFKGMIGLHASFTVADDILARTKEAIDSGNCGSHIHLCEDVSDRSESLKNYGKNPVERFVNAGIVNEKSIFAHCIHLSDEEIITLGGLQPAAALNIDSNLNNAVGLARYKKLQESLLLLAGTDGMHANLAKSQKQMFLLARHSGMSFDEAFAYFANLYLGQVKFVKRYFSDYPTLVAGDRADFIIWDYAPPTPLNNGNFFGHYIYGALEYPVHTVVQQGNFLMKNFILQSPDEGTAKREIYKQGERLYNLFSE